MDAMNVTSLVFADIMLCSVGQVAIGPEVEGGV